MSAKIYDALCSYGEEFVHQPYMFRLWLDSLHNALRINQHLELMQWMRARNFSKDANDLIQKFDFITRWQDALEILIYRCIDVQKVNRIICCELKVPYKGYKNYKPLLDMYQNALYSEYSYISKQEIKKMMIIAGCSKEAIQIIMSVDICRTEADIRLLLLYHGLKTDAECILKSNGNMIVIDLFEDEWFESDKPVVLGVSSLEDARPSTSVIARSSDVASSSNLRKPVVLTQEWNKFCNKWMLNKNPVKNISVVTKIHTLREVWTDFLQTTLYGGDIDALLNKIGIELQQHNPTEFYRDMTKRLSGYQVKSKSKRVLNACFENAKFCSDYMKGNIDKVADLMIETSIHFPSSTHI
jgi:hypothetical protein